MNALETLIAAVQASTEMAPAKKEILLQFLQACGPVLWSLDSSTLQGLLEWIAGGGGIPESVDALDAGQVVALLDVTQQAMDAALEQRLAQVATARAALNSLANTALAVLARLLVSAL